MAEWSLDPAPPQQQQPATAGWKLGPPPRQEQGAAAGQTRNGWVLGPSPSSPGPPVERGEVAPSYFERNKAWTKPGAAVYQTHLEPEDERRFQAWVKQNKVPFDAGPRADYDMRGFWKALQAGDPRAKSAVDPNDKRLHYPDYWKTPYHETFSAESQWADPTKAPKWNDKDQLVMPDGRVLFDDRAKERADARAQPDSAPPAGGILGSLRQGGAAISKGLGGEGGQYKSPLQWERERLHARAEQQRQIEAEREPQGATKEIFKNLTERPLGGAIGELSKEQALNLAGGEAGAGAARELRPAVKTPDGIKVGRLGDNHDTIVPNAPEQDRGFVDERGKFLTRQQAAARVPGVAGQAEGGKGRPDSLASEDLNKAQGLPERKGAAPLEPPRTFAVDNALLGKRENVRVLQSHGKTSAVTEDGHIIDITDMVKAGRSIEDALHYAFGEGERPVETTGRAEGQPARPPAPGPVAVAPASQARGWTLGPRPQAPILGKSGLPAASRQAPAFTPQELARAKAAREGAARERELADLGRGAGRPRRPVDLLQFLADKGGLQDQGGELRSMDAQRKFMPGHGMLVRVKGGVPLDRAREAAEEAGYLPKGSDINTLLDAIRDSLRGEHRFSERDEAALAEWRAAEDRQRATAAGATEYRAELEQRADRLGVEWQDDVTDEELLADVIEREALMGQGDVAHAHLDQLEAEIDRRIGAALPDAGEALPWFNEERPTGQARAQPAAAGGPAPPRGGSEAAGRAAPRLGAPGPRAAGGGGGSGAGRPPVGGAPPSPPPRGPGPAAPLPPSVAIPPRGLIDDFRSIFSPGKRGEAAQATAGMVREGLARREQAFQQAAENLRGFGREMGKLSPVQRLGFIDAYETGDLGAYGGHPLGRLASEIHRLFDERYDAMERRGIAPAYVENYLGHLWRNPGEAATFFQRAMSQRTLEGAKGFKKERTFPTVREGMEAGLVPVTDNPIELSLLQLHEMDKFITAQDIINEMEAEGLAVRVPHDERPPAGWVPIDDKIARKGNALLYAPEPAALIVNRTLAPGLSGRPIYDAVRSVGNMLNSAQLGVSGFHAVFVAADAATSAIAKGIKQISRGEPGEIIRGFGNIARAPAAPVMNYLRGRKVLLRYLDDGPPTAEGHRLWKIVDALIAGGGRAKMDSFYRGSYAGSFWQAMRGSLMKSSGRATLSQDLAQMFRDAAPITVRGVPIAPGAVRAAAQLVPRVMDTIMAPLMEDYVPKMKLGVFYDLMADELRRAPDMSRAQLRQVAGRLWDSVDNRLGQLAYDNLFWNKALKDVGHIAVRSLGWNLGTLRELAGGALDLAKGRSIASGAAQQLTDRASYVIAVPIATALMGALYGYLKTGNRPQELRDYFFPKTGGKDAQGGDNRVSMPGYFKDAYEWATQPGQTAKGKIHPLWQTLYEMMNNERWNGAAITDARSGVGLPQVKDYSAFLMQQFSPLSLRPPPNATEDSGITGAERFFGVREAPYRVREPERSEGIDRHVLSTKVRKGRRTGIDYSE